MNNGTGTEPELNWRSPTGSETKIKQRNRKNLADLRQIKRRTRNENHRAHRAIRDHAAMRDQARRAGMMLFGVITVRAGMHRQQEQQGDEQSRQPGGGRLEPCGR